MTTPKSRSDPRSPYVVLDVDVQDDLVELVLLNLGETPAHEVRVTLEPPLNALGGEMALDQLPLFRCLGVLRPHRQIRIFVDRLGSLLRREPHRFRATVSWRDDEGRAHERAFAHDLRAFDGLPAVHRSR